MLMRVLCCPECIIRVYRYDYYEVGERGNEITTLLKSIINLSYFLEQNRVCINKQAPTIQGYLLTFTTE